MTGYSGFCLAFRTMSLKAAVDLNISSVFEGTADTNGFALLLDAIVSTDFDELNVLSSGYSYRKKVGTGVRIAMSMTNVTADVKLNFASVAAQTKLGKATTRYQVEGIALDLDTIRALFEVSMTGDLDDATFAAIRKALSETLPAYLESNEVTPSEYVVPVATADGDASTLARAVVYAASMVGRRMGLLDAIQNRPSGINPEMVVVQYAQLAGLADTSSNTPPTVEQATRANRWLATGALQ